MHDIAAAWEVAFSKKYHSVTNSTGYMVSNV